MQITRAFSLMRSKFFQFIFWSGIQKGQLASFIYNSLFYIQYTLLLCYAPDVVVYFLVI